MLPRNNLRRAAVLSVGLAAACRGASAWQARLQAEPLYQRSQKLRESAACAKLVPMEFGETLPVPVEGGRFKVLFYPLFAAPGKSEALSPAFEGAFAPGDAGRDVCAPLKENAPSSRGPAVPAGTSQTAYYRAEASFYASLAGAAELYAKGASAQDADKRKLGEFVDSFLAIAEPGLLPDYYRVNPGFWEWLRREAGRSIPKPAS